MGVTYKAVDSVLNRPVMDQSCGLSLTQEPSPRLRTAQQFGGNYLKRQRPRASRCQRSQDLGGLPSRDRPRGVRSSGQRKSAGMEPVHIETQSFEPWAASVPQPKWMGSSDGGSD